MNDFEGLIQIQKEFEDDVMTIITILNQNGLSYEAIKNMIDISIINCLNNYDNNRKLFTKMYKKLEKEYNNNE
jgi:hypothetical protein